MVRSEFPFEFSKPYPIDVDPRRIDENLLPNKSDLVEVRTTWEAAVGNFDPIQADKNTLETLWRAMAWLPAGMMALNMAIDPEIEILNCKIQDEHFFDLLDIDYPNDVLVAPQAPLCVLGAGRHIHNIEFKLTAPKSVMPLMDNAVIDKFTISTHNPTSHNVGVTLLSHGEFGFRRAEIRDGRFKSINWLSCSRGAKIKGVFDSSQIYFGLGMTHGSSWDGSSFIITLLDGYETHLLSQDEKNNVLEELSFENVTMESVSWSNFLAERVRISGRGLGVTMKDMRVRNLILDGLIVEPVDPEKQVIKFKGEKSAEEEQLVKFTFSAGFSADSRQNYKVSAKDSRLINFNFSGVLPHADFCGAYLESGSFAADLVSSKWVGATLKKVRFEAGSLIGADFTNVSLEDVSFSDKVSVEGVLVPPDCRDVIKNILD